MGWLIFALRTGLLALHVVANALAGGAPLAAALLPGKEQDRWKLAALGLWALAVGLLSGLPAVLMVLAGAVPGYQAAATRLPAGAYGMLTAEWAFTAVLYAAYLLTWERLAQRRWLHGLIAVVAATNLLYHFPTMMIVLGSLAQDPSLTDQPIIARSVFRSLMWRPHELGQTLHFWGLSALAAGIATMAVGAWRRWGELLTLLGFVVLFLSGNWLLWSGDAGRSLLSLHAASGWLMLGGVACGLLIMTQVSLALVGRSARPAKSMALALATAVLMTAAMLAARE